MDYLGYNVSAAYALNTQECGRKQNYLSTSAMGWWCLSREAANHPEGDCLDL